MKNIIRTFSYPLLLMVVGLFVMNSCDEADGRVTWSGEYVEFNSSSSSSNYLRENDGQSVSDEFQVNLVSAQKSSDVSVTVSVDGDNTTAIEGVHYSLASTNVTIGANSNIAGLPIEIFDENIEPGESWVITLNITSADVELGPNTTLTHTFGISCPSSLDGEYAFVTTNMTRAGADFPGTTTGTVTIGETTTNGVYTISDASFGQFPFAWGDNPASGPGWIDVCDVLAYDDTSDQYGDTYSLSNVSVSADGTELTFDWVNTYGDGGTTTLTNADGWPSSLTSD